MVLLTLIFCSVTIAFEYTEEALKYTDPDVDPCDDFYRHACRIGVPEYLPFKITHDNIEEVKASRNEAPKSYEELSVVEEDIKNGFPEFEKQLNLLVTSIFENMCKSNQETKHFLSDVESIIFPKAKTCNGVLCLTHLAKDNDCKRVADHLRNITPRGSVNEIRDFTKSLNVLIAHIRHSDLYTYDSSQTEGLDNLFLEIKNVAIELILNTPWAQNHNVSESIAAVVNPIYIINAIEKKRNLALKLVADSQEIYVECKNRYANVTSSLIMEFCFLYTKSELVIDKEILGVQFTEEQQVDDILIAGTIYPYILLGSAWYFMFETSASHAAKLGTPGFVLAHELSHALIKSSDFDILTYFSDEARSCIQKQYESSCSSFDEGNCKIEDVRFEENGADVFAFEIIWNLYERHYLDKEKRIRQFEGSTEMKQLFYSLATALCSGNKSIGREEDIHSPNNVRINAVANHPAFKKAFQCSEDSKMMKSRTKQCSVYGKNAPFHRRRFSPTYKK